MQLCRQVWCWSFVYWRRFTVCKTITFISRFKEILWTYLICQKMLWEWSFCCFFFLFFKYSVLSLCRIYTFIKLSQVPRQVKFSFAYKVPTLDYTFIPSSSERSFLNFPTYILHSKTSLGCVWFTSFVILFSYLPGARTGVWSSLCVQFKLRVQRIIYLVPVLYTEFYISIFCYWRLNTTELK